MLEPKVTELSEIDEILIRVSLDPRLHTNKDINLRLRALSDSEFERWISEGLFSSDDVTHFKKKLLTTGTQALFVSTLFRGWINTGKLRNVEEAIALARLLNSIKCPLSSFAILSSHVCREVMADSTVSIETMMLYIKTIGSVGSLKNIEWQIDRITGSIDKRREIEEQYFRNWVANLSIFLLRNIKVRELLQQGLSEKIDQMKEIALSLLVKYRDAAIKFTVGTEKYFKESDVMISAADENRGMSQINELQKRIIEGTLAFPFESISELESNEATAVLRCLLTREISPDALLSIVSLGIDDEVKFIHDVMLHPCPQNRSTSYPYFGQPSDPSMVVYKDEHGRPAFERRGLLSLTAKNDENTVITRDATCSYIVSLVEAEIKKLSNSPSIPGCSFWETDSVQITFNELFDNLNKYYMEYKRLDENLVSKIKTFPKLGLLFSRCMITTDNLEMAQRLLIYFSGIGDIESIRGLLSHHKVDVDFIKDNHATALSEAAGSNQPEVVRLLLNKGSVINPHISGDSPFLWAVWRGHSNVIRVFLEARKFNELIPANDMDKLQSALFHLRANIRGTRDEAAREEKTREYNTITSLISAKMAASHDSTGAKPPSLP
ncbi:MAG TPA: ankyrin repeat domain-containing protein [Gammaproteobacteria bacterium]|nr:ankyrin repeat domain-containing protein [Gammaproteobacteria bacterium]